MKIAGVPRKRSRGLHEGQPPQTLAPQPGDVKISTQDIDKRIDSLAELRIALGVPLSADRSEARAFEVVDPTALLVSPVVTQAMTGLVPLAQESGVTDAELGERAEQVEQITLMMDLSADAEAAATDSQRVVAKVQRDLRQALHQQAEILAAGPELKPEEKRDLLLELRLLKKELEQVQKDRQQQADKTVADKAKAAARVAEEQKREDVLRTLSRLRGGGPVTTAELRQAYESLIKDDERRDSSR